MDGLTYLRTDLCMDRQTDSPVFCRTLFPSGPLPKKHNFEKSPSVCLLKLLINLSAFQYLKQFLAFGNLAKSIIYYFPIQVGSSTARYYDNTDFRTGGCFYSWMLSVPGNSPMWLKNLGLCMKWKATGDRQQCGNNRVPDTICTKSNQWSLPYNDDSSARWGGCMMSWGMKP